MPRGINKVIIVGNLGNDPDSKTTPSGLAVTKLSVATSRSWKDKRSGEQKEQTEWHRVVMFDRLGEIAAEYLRKGSQVYIEGRLQTQKWQDKDGNDRWTTEIVANEMQMLGGRAGGNAPANYDESQQSAQPPSAPSSAPPPSGGNDVFDDDIPF